MGQLRAAYRLAGFGALVVSLGVQTFVLGILWWPLQLTPLAKYRAFSMAKLMQIHFDLILRFVGFELIYELQDKDPLPRSGALFLANHVNYIDVLALGRWHPMGFVAKREVRHWPGLGWLIAHLNTLFVTRELVSSRLQCLQQLQKRLEQICYCIYPQGTTSDQLRIPPAPWYAGQLFCAIRPGATIYLVGIQYANHQKMAWIDNMTLGPHLWWLLQQPVNRAAIVIRRFVIEQENTLTLRQHSQRVRQQIDQLTERAGELLASCLQESSVRDPYQNFVGKEETCV